MSEAIVKSLPAVPVRAGGFEMTAEQEKLIRDTFLSGATPQEAAVLLEVAKARRLNPLTRQIYFVKRWDGQKKAFVWAFQVGIDGFRAIAERTGLYDGQDEAEFEHGKDGLPVFCRVRVYRKGWSRPAVGTAYFREYVQRTKEGLPNSMWERGPHFMLAKCAEAAALRKAFPEDCGDIYIPEEMGNEERELNAPPEGASRTEQVRNIVQAQLAAQTQAPAPRLVEAKRPVVVDVADGETEEQAERRANEPPPPGDEDAPPHDAMTGEPFPQEPKAAASKPSRAIDTSKFVVSFGRAKGKALPDIDEENLRWLRSAYAQNVEDPAKARFKAKNSEFLAAIDVELGSR